MAVAADVMLVRARGEQHANDIDVAEEARRQKRRPTITGYSIYIGATGRELAHNSKVALSACINK
jgi:hypothetical protein